MIQQRIKFMPIIDSNKYKERQLYCEAEIRNNNLQEVQLLEVIHIYRSKILI